MNHRNSCFFLNFCLNEEIALLGKKMDSHKVAEKSIEDNEVHLLGLIRHLYIIFIQKSGSIFKIIFQVTKLIKIATNCNH